jgi:HAD superfamily hydrolase (TIGR01509 family)
MDAFEHICGLLGVDTSEAIMIDDNADNCRGAVLTGMHAVDYDGLAHLQRSLETLLHKK